MKKKKHKVSRFNSTEVPSNGLGGAKITLGDSVSLPINGKLVTFVLPKHPGLRAELEAEIKRKISDGESAEDLQFWLANQLAQPIATVGDLIGFPLPAKVDIKLPTLRRYRSSTLKVVEDVLYARDGHEPRSHAHLAGRPKGPLGADDCPLAAAMPIDQIDDALALEYIDLVVRDLEPHTDEYDKAYIGAKRTLWSMRGLFGERLMEAYRTSLFVPTPQSFLDQTGHPYQPPSANPPHHDRIYLAHRLVRDLSKVDMNLFLVAALALHAGLRRQEIITIHSSWLVAEPKPAIEVHGKNGRRLVPIPAWLYDCLRDRGEGPIFPGPTATRVLHCRACIRWFREHGFDGVEKVLQELRHLYAWFIGATQYPIVAMSILGYNVFDSMMRFCGETEERKLTPEMVALWSMPVPAGIKKTA